MKLDYFVRKYDILSNVECDYLINKYNEGWNKHSWANEYSQSQGSRDYDPEINYIDSEDSKILTKKIYDTAKQYSTDIGTYNSNSNIITTLSTPRLNKYDKDQTMHMHVDHIQTLFDGNNKGIPILSTIVVLNDNYTGGDIEFDFITEKKAYSISKGEILFWPSVFLYPHTIKPVSNGTRYSCVTWGW